jgi:hypothetical protein
MGPPSFQSAPRVLGRKQAKSTYVHAHLGGVGDVFRIGVSSTAEFDWRGYQADRFETGCGRPGLCVHNLVVIIRSVCYINKLWGVVRRNQKRG